MTTGRGRTGSHGPYDTPKARAWKHFYPGGDGKAKPGYCLHHSDPSLFYSDPERYAEWRPEDLEMLTRAEHTSIHQKRKEDVFSFRQSHLKGQQADRED